MEWISREEAITAACEGVDAWDGGNNRGRENWIRAAVKALPAADVREVKQGEWRNNKNDYPECTECGYMPMFDPNMDDIYYSPYCPNCGAMMGGQDNA